MALTTLVLAASVRLIWLSKREATATPAASSDGFTILEPELSRDRDLASMSELVCRLDAAARAWMFVLITIGDGGVVFYWCVRPGIRGHPSPSVSCRGVMSRRAILGQGQDPWSGRPGCS